MDAIFNFLKGIREKSEDAYQTVGRRILSPSFNANASRAQEASRRVLSTGKSAFDTVLSWANTPPTSAKGTPLDSRRPFMAQIQERLDEVPVLGRIRQFSRDTFGTDNTPMGKVLRGETLTPEEEQQYAQDLALSFTPMGITKAAPKADLGKLAVMGKNKMRELGEKASKSQKIQALQHLMTDATQLRQRGFKPDQINRISISESRKILQNNITPKEWADNASRAAGEFFNKSNLSVKSKVNVIDYLRTPAKVLEKIGFADEAKLLRKQYDAYVQELPKEIEKVTAWSKRVAPESNVRIFQWLDGKPVKLDPNELQVATEIKTYLKGWADKLGLPEDKRISNYITHIWEKGQIEKEFDEDFASLIRDRVAGSVYDPFLQQRQGKQEYIEDTWRALDSYIKRATRKFHMDQALEKVAQKAEYLDDASYKYVKGYVDRINMRPTDLDNLIDNAIKSTPIGYKLGQRPTANVTQKARQMVYRGLLGLNPASALRNLSQSTNTYATLGERDFLIGAVKTIQNLPKYAVNADTELNRVGVLSSDFIQDRTLNATKKFWQQTDDVLFYMFNSAEKINRSIAYYGAKSQGLRKGLSEAEAIEYAKGIVRKTQFAYDAIDTPRVLQSDIAKTLLQFGTYPLKQAEFLAGMVARKDVAGSVRWVASNLLFIHTIGQALGLDWKDMFPSFRFGVPPTLQAPYGAFQVATGQPDQYGNEPDPNLLTRAIENKNLTKGLMNYVPAGGQMVKTYEGVKALNEGGSYSKSGRLQYPVDSILAPVLGKSTTQEAQNYYDNKLTPLSEKQTEEYQMLLQTGVSPAIAYNHVNNSTASFEKELKKVIDNSESEGFDLFSLFKGKEETGKGGTPRKRDDLLLQALDEETTTDENAAKIRQIFELGENKEQINMLLKKYNLGTYETASYQMMRSLGVENGQRPKLIRSMIQDKSPEEQMKVLSKLAEEKVFTDSVVDQWYNSGVIGDVSRRQLKTLIDVATGKKATGSTRRPKTRATLTRRAKLPEPVRSLKFELSEYNPKPLQPTKYNLRTK